METRRTSRWLIGTETWSVGYKALPKLSDLAWQWKGWDSFYRIVALALRWSPITRTGWPVVSAHFTPLFRLSWNTETRASRSASWAVPISPLRTLNSYRM